MTWAEDLLKRQSSAVSTIVRPYATWSVLRRARRRSKVTENRAARKYARSRITLAVNFLNGLENDGRSLQAANQTDIDLWLAIVGTKPPPTPWLFPGGAPGHHARASWISEQLNRDLGISLRRARNTALCALAGDLPASVLADLLGIHITTAMRWTKLVKRDWAEYVGERSTAISAPNE